MKTYITAIVIIIILALGGYLYMNRTIEVPEQETPAPTENEQVFCTMDAMECPDGSYVGRVGPSCEFAACPGATTPTTSTTPKTHTVIYTDDGFAPGVITVKVGDTVTFKNNSSRNFWPASDNHPTHEVYAAFDPEKGIAAGQSWSFTFTEKGSWTYHDHLRARLVGIVVVE